MNIQHRTSNIERSPISAQAIKSKYDLEQRLLEYASKIIHLVEELPNTRTGNHIATQLLRSGASPLPNHGEAQAAESPADFVHKLKICLRASFKITRGAVFGEKAGWQGATKENIPGGSSTEEQRGQAAFSPKTLRATGPLPGAGVGSGVTARFGDAPPSPPWPQSNSLVAAPLVILKQALEELRESYRWILLIQRASLLKSTVRIQPLLDETQELIRIFVASIRTSEKRKSERIARAETQ